MHQDQSDLDTDNPSPKLYPFHSQWPSVATLEALADTPYYRALFAREFDTFNADYKGFWLLRPDGTRSPVCQLFQ